MEQELKEKLNIIDQQIQTEKDLYKILTEQEQYYKTDNQKCQSWSSSTINREKEIFDTIHQLQLSKNRLITGEKPPEIVYIDVPRETIKYITTREIHVNKSSLASVVAWGSVLIWAALAAAYYFKYFIIVF